LADIVILATVLSSAAHSLTRICGGGLMARTTESADEQVLLAQVLLALVATEQEQIS
jgi:hypothetical protein